VNNLPKVVTQQCPDADTYYVAQSYLFNFDLKMHSDGAVSCNDVTGESE